jgi:hypothetical protein
MWMMLIDSFCMGIHSFGRRLIHLAQNVLLDMHLSIFSHKETWMRRIECIKYWNTSN